MNYENEPHVLRTVDGGYVSCLSTENFTEDFSKAMVFSYKVYHDMWAGVHVSAIPYEKAARLEASSGFMLWMGAGE